MTWRACDHGDGPEPLPPEELLRTRRVLAQPTRPEIRGQHVAAAAAEARRAHALASAQTIARRSARVIAGVAATIVVTSSLAGAQILVEPARAIFPAVSDHFLPNRSADQDPGDYVPLDEEDRDETSTTQVDPTVAKATKPATEDSATTPPAKKKPSSTTTAPPSSSSTTSTSSSSTSSTSTSTTTTEPDGSTTTTTEPDGSTTTTTEPDPSTTTTTAPTTTKSPPAWGRNPG